MYVHTIAKTIAENAKPKIRPEWFPNIPNPPAMRLAIEFVSDWLADKKMDLTLDIAKLESNSLLGVDRHQAGWVERRLELEVYEPVIPQLINIKNASKASERGFDNGNKKPRKGQLSTEKDLRLVQSSDESEFSDQSILDDAIAKRNELLEHNLRKHKHHHKSPLENKTRELAKKKADEIESQIRINENDTFTESSDDDANIWDPQYGLDKQKREELEEKKKLAAERKELRRAQEEEKKRRQERKKHRHSETPSQYSYSTYGTNPSDYSYYSTENSYSRSSSHRHRHSSSHGHSHGHHHRRSNRSDYSYSTYGSYQTPSGYSSYTYSNGGSSYSYSTTQQQPTVTTQATQNQQQQQQQQPNRPKATRQEQGSYTSFTSPPNTSIQVPAPPLPPPPPESSYATGYTDIDTRVDSTTKPNGNPSEYSYTYSTNSGSYYSYGSYQYDPSYEYSQTYQSQNRRGGKKGPGTWTELEQNPSGAVYVGPSPFAPEMVSRSTSEHAPMYMPPPSVNSSVQQQQRQQQIPQQAPPPQMRRQPPVQRPVQAPPNAPDYLQKFNENENDASGEGTTDILRNYANPPTRGSQNRQGGVGDYFAPDNQRNPGVIVHQQNIVEEHNIYQ